MEVLNHQLIIHSQLQLLILNLYRPKINKNQQLQHRLLIPNNHNKQHNLKLKHKALNLINHRMEMINQLILNKPLLIDQVK